METESLVRHTIIPYGKQCACIIRCHVNIRFLMKLRIALAALLVAAGANAAGTATPESRSSRHALLIVVGNYGAGFPRLAGTGHDIEHAAEIARSLGIPGEHVRLLRDRDANAEAIRRAGTDLALRIAPSDQVLIYFSGLGGARADLDRPGGCEETFIAADGTPVGHGELAGYFLPVAERAEKTMVFFDSCNLSQAGERDLSPRCVPSRDPACKPGRNQRWRGFVTELRKHAVPTANIIGMLAGRPEDPAFDDAAGGGMFSNAIRRCIGGAATHDSNGSGALSFDELASCAQARIDRRMPPDRRAKALMLGNRGFAPWQVRGGPGPAQLLLEDLSAGRDGRRELVLGTVLSGGEAQGLTVRASTVGYLYLVAADPQGGYKLLFPNGEERDNRLHAGATFSWPQPGARATLARGTTVLAIVADNPRDLAMLPDAGRRQLPSDAAGREALYRFVTTSVRSGEPACQEKGAARKLALARACSDTYAAALVVIDSR